MLHIKILGIQYPERYALRRLVQIALNEVQAGHPEMNSEIREVNDPTEIGKYARVLILPSLVVNEKLVCSARFPTKEEVVAWLKEAAKK
ncbi:MAG: thioredoxin family protein [Anaerolineales bacterium]|nr:thioredoxin family protein [Anaerolineales bacterium]